MATPTSLVLGVPTVSNKLAELVIAAKRVRDGKPDEILGENKKLQFWPESIQDSKSSVYSDKQIPGGSHPVKQWVSGGPRTLSFTIMISRDTLEVDTAEETNDQYNVDVAAGVAWLRSMMYPLYDPKTGFSEPPPVMLLDLPNSGIGAFNQDSSKDQFQGVLNQCDVTYQAFFNDGTPRYVEVSVTFEEVVQSAAGITFHGRANAKDVIARWKTTKS